MTPRERVLAAIEHRQPDKCPYDIGFTERAFKAMVEYTGNPNPYALFESHLAGYHVVPMGHCPTDTCYVDAFGVEWDRSRDRDIGIVANRMVTPDNIEDYEFPSLSDFEIPPEDADWGRFRIAHIGFSLFERAWTLTGMPELLMAMVDNPAFAHRLFDRVLEYNLRAIALAVTKPVDAMYFGDDWGQQTSLIMGPKLWREFIKPCLAEMYGAVRKAGKYVVIHSCGKVDELFPELIELGLNVFNPFQPEVMDVFEMKRLYGDKLTFYGGISTQRTLPYGTPEQTREEVLRLIEKVGKNGGYIAAPAHAIPGDAKPENIMAMIEVLVNQ